MPHPPLARRRRPAPASPRSCPSATRTRASWRSATRSTRPSRASTRPPRPSPCPGPAGASPPTSPTTRRASRPPMPCPASPRWPTPSARPQRSRPAQLRLGRPAGLVAGADHERGGARRRAVRRDHGQLLSLAVQWGVAISRSSGRSRRARASAEKLQSAPRRTLWSMGPGYPEVL